MRKWLQHRYRLVRLAFKAWLFRRKLAAARRIWRLTERVQERLKPFLLRHDPAILYPTLEDRYTRPVETRYGGHYPR